MALDEKWTSLRNRVLADPRFQRWAAGTPLIGRVARRRASGLFDLLAGFTYSQITLAAVETGLLDALREAPQTTATLARRISLSDAAMQRLLKAAAALGLAEQLRSGQWTLGQQGAVLQANHGAQAMVRHHRILYRDLADPVALLKADRQEATGLARFWNYDPHRAEVTETQQYSELMAVSQAMVSDVILGAYDFARHRSALDVGGGHGAFARALRHRHRHLVVGVFDLPPVLEGLEGNGVARHPGSFLTDPLPTGYDCHTLVRILHDHDDAAALTILRAIRAALPDAGRLVIAEPMAETRGAEGMGDAYFGLYLWAMGSGQPRSAGDIGRLLEQAGFRRWREHATDQTLVARLIVAQP